MGLFDWMFGGDGESRGKVPVLPDRIWLTTEAKANGIAGEVTAALRSNDPPIAVLLVAHFEDSLTSTRAIAARPELEGLPVHVVMADQLDRPFDSEAEHDESEAVLFLVSERHPLRHRDYGVVEFAGNLRCRAKVAFHLSLEDGLLPAFMQGWVEHVLKTVGLAEDEVIESAMITHRIADTQKKIARSASGDEPARSVEEWFRRNCPKLGTSEG